MKRISVVTLIVVVSVVTVSSALGQTSLDARRSQLNAVLQEEWDCLLYTSPSPRDGLLSRMPSSA